MEAIIKTFNEQVQVGDNGIISGYANVYNVKDLQGDVSLPNSFVKTVSERAKKILVYKNHNDEQLIGIPKELDINDPYGLHITAQLNMDTELGRDAFYEAKFLLENGFNSGFSIGGWVVKRSKDNASEVQEYKLREISLLTKEPANELSLVDTVKAVKSLTDVTQDEFWQVIEKAYNERFSDNVLKSLEAFLTLKDGQPQTSTPEEEPSSIIQSIYKNYI